MSLFSDKWQRIALYATILVLFSSILAGGAANSNAASPQQVIATPTPGTPTAKPNFLTDPVPDPKQAGVLWFAATGHTLRGPFLDYWSKYGGLAQFGYPTTEEFFETVGSDNKQYQVQYFQRNRFERHPENAGTPYEALLGTLGRNFHAQDAPATPLPNAEYFSETGHNLSGTFKAYWDTHGGLFVHGFPITEELKERNPTDGKEYTVQYFERSRFELHPENTGTQYEVLLGLLGTQLAGQQGYFSGAYPRYGHAADFSWVSGRTGLLYPHCGGPPQCGYQIFLYEDQDRGGRVQLSGLVWETYRSANYATIGNMDLVLFGELVGGGGCSVDPDAMNYKVDKVQLNPSDVVPR